jgi:hypothetical protein
MSKIGNTTDYAVTTPASSDMVIGTDVSNTSNDSTGETVNFLMSGIASFVLGSTTPFSFCQVRNTDTSTNINQATAANIPFGGTNDATDSDYTLASDSITVNFDGVVTVQAHISQSGSVARTNVGIWITNNSTKVSGVGQSGYIRAQYGNHNESSSHISATFSVSDGDVIRVQGEERAADGTVNQIAGESQVTVYRCDGVAGPAGGLLASNNLSDVANAGTSRTNLGLAIGTDVQAYDADTLKANTAANLTATFTAAIDDDGTITTGTYTPTTAAGSQYKKIIGGGAFTLAPPVVATDTATTLSLFIINNSSAGAITTSGFTKVAGDAFTTTDGDKFSCRIEVNDIGGTEYSTLTVLAMQ